MQFLIMKVQNTPELRDSPMGQQFLQIIQSGDQNAGIEMANNILNSFQISREQGIQQAASGLSRLRF